MGRGMEQQQGLPAFLDDATALPSKVCLALARNMQPTSLIPGRMDHYLDLIHIKVSYKKHKIINDIKKVGCAKCARWKMC